jgi:flagellar L-ring protein precursor FlgH
VLVGAVVALLLMWADSSTLFAQSLFREDSNIFSDRKPTRVGDIVTVVVTEESSTKDEAKSKANESTANDIKEGNGLFDYLDFLTGIGFGTDAKAEGNSKSERTYTMTSNVSCLVTEVMGNGNLVIQGTRDLTTHDEKLKIRFTGVVRPRDIATDNTVPSSKVANAEISVDGKGSLSRTQRRGLITQILHALF